MCVCSGRKRKGKEEGGGGAILDQYDCIRDLIGCLAESLGVPLR